MSLLTFTRLTALTVFFIGCFFSNDAQTIILNDVTDINVTVDEASGLTAIDNSLYSHNDDTDAKLFEINDTNGSIIREVVILNGTNTDWEDLCFDDQFAYIGDFGNNGGSRTNLKIYKCNINNNTNTLNNFLIADIISFDYSEQTNFNPGYKNHNYDAEALIAKGDFLYLFTKNWINDSTNVYQISKEEGTYSISKYDQLKVPALVTAATYVEEYNTVVLLGYNEEGGIISDNFLSVIYDFGTEKFSEGKTYEIDIIVNGSKKTEGISRKDSTLNFFICAEQVGNLSASLYDIDLEILIDSLNYFEPVDTTEYPIDTSGTDTTVNIINFENRTDVINIFPNPVKDYFEIEYFEPVVTKLYDSTGNLILETRNNKIDISSQSRGIYFVEFKDLKNKLIEIHKLIKQ